MSGGGSDATESHVRHPAKVFVFPNEFLLQTKQANLGRILRISSKTFLATKREGGNVIQIMLNVEFALCSLRVHRFFDSASKDA